MKIEVYSGEGCANCVALKRKFKEANIEFVEKDVMEYMSEARELGIRSLPTTVFYKGDDKVVVTGLAAFEKVKEIVNG